GAMGERKHNGRRVNHGAPAWAPGSEGFSRQSVLVGSYRMSYVTGGQGMPVLLLHGIGSGCSVWRHTPVALAPHLRRYALDLLGCGASEKPPIDYSIETLARSVGAFTETLGIQRAHIIGHSLGGGVALRFHTLFPERVERLVLVASGGLGRELHWIIRI